MVEFTEIKRIFVLILLDLDLSVEEIAAILMLIQTEEQMSQMADYIEENQEATMEMLLEKATAISQA